MKEMVEYIIKNLVKHTDQVRVHELVGQHIVIIEVEVAKEDIGLIIGKEGTMIRAIRTIMMTIANRNGQRITIEIIE